MVVASSVRGTQPGIPTARTIMIRGTRPIKDPSKRPSTLCRREVGDALFAHLKIAPQGSAALSRLPGVVGKAQPDLGDLFGTHHHVVRADIPGAPVNADLRRHERNVTRMVTIKCCV
jgi:hypothetical protein